MKESKTENYVPYGKEWKAEMMKCSKSDLIDELKRAYIAKIEVENQVNKPQCKHEPTSFKSKHSTCKKCGKVLQMKP